MSIRKCGYVILGAVVMSLSLNLFLIPGRIAPGGISGLATVIGYFTNLPVGLMIFLINIPVFIWGMFEFDRKFLINSLIGTVSLSLSTEAFSYFVLENPIEIKPAINDINITSIKYAANLLKKLAFIKSPTLLYNIF